MDMWSAASDQDYYAARGWRDDETEEPDMRDVVREQINESTDDELRDRLDALRERYDPKHDGGCFPAGGYPMDQLRELHLIEEALRDRAKRQERELEAALYSLDQLAGEETPIARAAQRAYGELAALRQEVA